jgi:hypothetical protein
MSQLHDLDPLIEAVLARTGEPLTVAAVIRGMPAGRKPKPAQMLELLNTLVRAGRIHRWPGAAARFSTVEPLGFARDQVLGALSRRPLTDAELKKRLPASVRSLAKAALATLVAERRVFRHPKLGLKVRVALTPPDPFDYLPPELEVLYKRMAKLGFDAAQSNDALRRHFAPTGVQAPPAEAHVPADAGAEILAAMSRLNSQTSRGALVNLSELRAATAARFADRSAFDRAVLALAEQGRVQLQTHPWPGRLSLDERSALVPDGRGGFFDAIGIRLE